MLCTIFCFCRIEHQPPRLDLANWLHLPMAIVHTTQAGDYMALLNHPFRRFRNPYLRNNTPRPDGVQKFWMGHAGETMTDLYDKVKEDLQFRLEWPEKWGIGFNLSAFGPSVVPNVPNVPRNEDIEKAACAA